MTLKETQEELARIKGKNTSLCELAAAIELFVTAREHGINESLDSLYDRMKFHLAACGEQIKGQFLGEYFLNSGKRKYEAAKKRSLKLEG